MQTAINVLIKQCFGAISILLTLLTSVSCSPTEDEVAEAKFTALAQQKGGSDNILLRATGDGYLIGRLNLKKWQVVYGFEDNNDCNGVFTGQAEDDLKNTMLESMRVWMSPLSEVIGDKEIIDLSNVEFIKKYTVRDTEGDDPPADGSKPHRIMFENRYEHYSTELAIIFYCRKERSFITLPDINKLYFPLIHLYAESFDSEKLKEAGMSQSDIDLTAKDYMQPLNTDTLNTDNFQSYRRTVLHHEMGHAFGLADTYAEAGLENVRFAQSTGGAKETAGKQPISVMSISYLFALNEDAQLSISQDDTEGIKWLYRYYTYDPDKRGFEIELTDCPEGYVYDEKETKGCIPEDTIAFELEHGNPQSVKKLMGKEQETVKHLDAAIASGNVETFKKLLAELKKTKALIQRIIIITMPIATKEKYLDFGRTVMHSAAWAHRVHGREFYQLLIDDGIPNHVENHYGITPKRIVDDSSPIGLEFLLKAGHLYLLRKAAYEGDVEQAKESLTALSNVNALRINVRYGGQRTLLHNAAVEGHADIVELLLEQQDIDINSLNYPRSTPLVLAAWKGHTEVVKLLLAHADIEVNKQNRHGHNALHWAAYNGHTEVVRLLLEHADIDTSLQAEDGATAASAAAKQGHADIVQLLQEKEGM